MTNHPSPHLGPLDHSPRKGGGAAKFGIPSTGPWKYCRCGMDSSDLVKSNPPGQSNVVGLRLQEPPLRPSSSSHLTYRSAVRTEVPPVLQRRAASNKPFGPQPERAGDFSRWVIFLVSLCISTQGILIPPAVAKATTSPKGHGDTCLPGPHEPCTSEIFPSHAVRGTLTRMTQLSLRVVAQSGPNRFLSSFQEAKSCSLKPFGTTDQSKP